MNNLKENIFQLFLTFIGLISAYGISKLANEQNLPTYIVIIIMIAIAIIVLLLSNMINEARIKNQYNFEERLKGLWIESYFYEEEVVRYGLIEIVYEESIKALHLKGSIYDKEGKTFANWNSKSVYLDRNKKSIIYVYEGESMLSRLEGNGYGKLDFSNSQGEVILSGTGYFEDKTTNYIPKNFNLDRLDNGLCEKLTGEASPKHSFHKENLVKKYHEYLSEEKYTQSSTGKINTISS